MISSLHRVAAQNLAAGGLIVGLAGCGSVDTGVVELNWVFVDRDGDAIFPAGQLSLGRSDACALDGRIAGSAVDYDLQVELEICDPSCAEGCGADACDVVSPLRFPCDAARGSDPDIPSGDDPYRFTVRTLVIANDDVCRNPEPTCIATPGPRERTVEPGLVTDLQVYQVVVDVDISAPASQGGALDLEACGCA